MKKGLKVTAIFCLFLILSVVTLSPVANAQNMDKIRAKEKYAHKVVEYAEKHMIPRYERYIASYISEDELNKITNDVKAEFLSISNGEITEDLEVILFLVSLIIAFFYTLFGANGFAFLACCITTFIVMFIPIMLISFGLAIVETGIFGLAGVFALFDVETIEELFHWYGIVGCLFIFIIIMPVFILLYLLAIPIVTVADMIVFFYSMLEYILDNYPLY